RACPRHGPAFGRRRVGIRRAGPRQRSPALGGRGEARGTSHPPRNFAAGVKPVSGSRTRRGFVATLVVGAERGGGCERGRRDLLPPTATGRSLGAASAHRAQSTPGS